MKLEGGCYCGELRYKASGDPIIKRIGEISGLLALGSGSDHEPSVR